MKGYLVFLNEEKKELEAKAVIKLNFKEDLVIKYSIDMFNDEDPCIIHRTYCVNKLGMEILEDIKKELTKEQTFTTEELPSFISEKIILPEGTKYVTVV